MVTPGKEFEQKADFLGAMNAFFFFTRRYVIVFYAVLGFAAVFAIFVSLFSIVLVLVSLISGGGLSEEFEFTLIVLIFFGLGFQAIMAAASIAFNLWQIIFRRDDEEEEFPETLERMRLIKKYIDGTRNFAAKFLIFLIPTVTVTLILVVPLFIMIFLFTSYIEFEQTPPDLLRGIFIPALFLVSTSVFLMNYNYYLRLQNLKN